MHWPGFQVILAAVVFTLLAVGLAPAQEPGTVQGRVIAADRSTAISGVLVTVAETELRALTDAAGLFRFGSLAPGRYVLRLERTGFETVEREVEVRAEAGALETIRMLPRPVVLDPIRVMARVRQLGRRVDVVSIPGFNASSLSQLLKGQSAGMSVVGTSGQAGAAHQIRIRGPRSLSPGRPLIFVDGVRVGSAHILAPTGTAQVLDFLDGINPADVEVIEVLRGPDAITLYGMEARDGVIRITTRRGGGRELP